VRSRFREELSPRQLDRLLLAAAVWRGQQ